VSLVAAFSFWQPSTVETRTVRIATEPPGAQLVLVPIDEYGAFRPKEEFIWPKQKSPAVIPRVPVGTYLVVAEVPDHGFHEVYRVVPGKSRGGGTYRHDSWVQIADGVIEVTLIVILPNKAVEKDMILIEGAKFTMGIDARAGKSLKGFLSSPAHQVEVASFFLDPTEITVGQFQKIRAVSPEMLRLYGPNYPDFDKHPVTHVSFHQALEVAELIGKRLPTEAEFEFAATDRGRFEYPWGWKFGNDAKKVEEVFWAKPRAWPVDKTEFDITSAGVRGLYSNVAEWTDSFEIPYSSQADPAQLRAYKKGEEYFRLFQDVRVVRGGPTMLCDPDNDAMTPRDYLLGAHNRFGQERGKQLPGLGFRGARSATPRFLREPN